MQSTRRKIMQGHAVMVFNTVLKRTELVERKGTKRSIWNWAVKNRLPMTEQAYCSQVTQPLYKADILKAEQKGKRFIYN